MENKIFKKGEKVFDIRYGWGLVFEVYTLVVYVKYSEEEVNYTYSKPDIKLLSYTEYTLQGFSQVRLPEKGELVLVKEEEWENWETAVFDSFVNGNYMDNNGSFWQYCKRFQFID